MAFLRHGGHWESHRTDGQTDWLTDSPPMSIGVASGHAMVFNDLANLPNTKCGLLLFTLAKHRRQEYEVFCLQPMPAMPDV